MFVLIIFLYFTMCWSAFQALLWPYGTFCQVGGHNQHFFSKYNIFTVLILVTGHKIRVTNIIYRQSIEYLPILTGFVLSTKLSGTFLPVWGHKQHFSVNAIISFFLSW